MRLPDNIAGLVKAQNEQDSTAFAQYFTEKATVSDEGSSYSGRDEIKEWIQQATKKYQMQLKPIHFNEDGLAAELTVEVTGTFPGSPAIMQYHIKWDGSLIGSLHIKG
ncbi:SnoaL-like protein [Larkinella arboricola]|uniref:SnoaL-like protein n=1 Tax=Larkinella arboricola TaxID=643671 RepID=A0A327WVT7_LARAB|nr:nuclear transport factor 2 family protein [Larkinella arboricola]RAJ93210.1 SnoaL-like protein [Larkinella arboricola]